MIPILLKIVPIGSIIKLVFYFILLSAAVGVVFVGISDAQETNDPEIEGEQEEDEFEPFEQVEADRWTNLTVHFVDYDHADNVARVYVSSDIPTRVVLTDGTRTETGYANRTITTVDGSDIITVDLWDSSNEHISVDAENSLWLHFGDSGISLTQNVSYPWVLSIGGIGLITVFTIGLNQIRKRKSRTADNLINI